MDNEPVVTREQMDETRASLSEKLETLEQRVVDTVQSATVSVTETVGNVKEAVAETVETVKDSLNLQLQTQRHPWGVVASSIALGYLGGCLLLRNRSARANGLNQQALQNNSRISWHPNGVFKGQRSTGEAVANAPAQPASQNPTKPGWLSELADQFGPEITKLKGMAIGTALSVVRDLMTQSLSDQLQPRLAEVIDSITVKLGGEPTQGRVMKDDSTMDCAYSSSESRVPSGLTRRDSQAATGNTV